METDSVAELVQRCLAGEKEAFGALVKQYRPATVGFCYRYVGDFEAANDLAQEAFLRAYFDLHALRDPASFGPWLRAITLRQCQSWLRRRSESPLRIEDLGLCGEPDTGWDLGDRIGQRLLAEHAVQTLPEPQRVTLTLKYVEGYSLAEIASRLHLPVETVRTRLRRARHRLKEVYTAMLTEGSTPSEQGDRFARRVLEKVEVVEMEAGLTWPLYACLHALGKEWSLSYLMGVTGAAFRLTVDERIGDAGPTAVLDWDVWFRTLRRLGVEVRVFNAQLKSFMPTVPTQTEEEFRAAQAAAWTAVRESLDRGVPAVAWMPMTVEQKAQGLCCEYGLLVGYDSVAGVYQVRLPRLPMYTVPWDGFGRADPVNWFNVIVLGPTQPMDERDLERDAARFAVEHALSARVGHGLGGYEVWRKALQSGTILPTGNPGAARLLREAREHAAGFPQEIAPRFPDAAAALSTAAREYRRVASAWGEYAAAFTPVSPDAASDPGKKDEGLRALEAAFAAEQAAIASLEQALSKMGPS
jgi:RNA polymerase sigma factor (sigma-70 family)